MTIEISESHPFPQVFRQGDNRSRGLSSVPLKSVYQYNIKVRVVLARAGGVLRALSSGRISPGRAACRGTLVQELSRLRV